MPRYRGTWESGGKFLRKSPHEDIIDIIDQLPKGFVSLYDNKKYKVKPKEIFLIGSSFGGPTVLLVSSDSRVTKVIALSPVIDWKKESRTESMDFLEKFTKSAFGNAYRFSTGDWRKLKSGDFYSPIREAKNLDGSKIMIIQALDDEVVPLDPIKDFIKITKCKSLFIKKGGHLSISLFMKDKKFYKIFKDFTKK